MMPYTHIEVCRHKTRAARQAVDNAWLATNNAVAKSVPRGVALLYIEEAKRALAQARKACIAVLAQGSQPGNAAGYVDSRTRREAAELLVQVKAMWGELAAIQARLT